MHYYMRYVNEANLVHMRIDDTRMWYIMYLYFQLRTSPSHTNTSFHKWMSHVTCDPFLVHMKVNATHIWYIMYLYFHPRMTSSHTNTSFHKWTSHVTYDPCLMCIQIHDIHTWHIMNLCLHIRERVFHIRICFVTYEWWSHMIHAYKNITHTHEIGGICTRHGSFICKRTYWSVEDSLTCDISCIYTCTHEAFLHIRIYPVTYEWVMSYMIHAACT